MNIAFANKYSCLSSQPKESSLSLTGNVVCVTKGWLMARGINMLTGQARDND